MSNRFRFLFNVLAGSALLLVGLSEGHVLRAAAKLLTSPIIAVYGCSGSCGGCSAQGGGCTCMDNGYCGMVAGGSNSE